MLRSHRAAVTINNLALQIIRVIFIQLHTELSLLVHLMNNVSNSKQHLCILMCSSVLRMFYKLAKITTF